MKLRLSEIKEAIREAILKEISIEDVGDICFATGSTHIMKTCSIGKDKFFLKFTDASLIDGFDPSLQILVEYLAYKVYALYSGINIPKIQLVYDRSTQQVGLASSAVTGKMAGSSRTDPKKLAKMLSAGVFVDVFLANWDVIGTGTGNIILGDDKKSATRIDPGGALTFRAQGGRKGSKFGAKPGELKTMMDPSFGGSGQVFQYADLEEAGSTFSSVPWGAIEQTLLSTTDEVFEELQTHNMKKLAAAWRGEASDITNTLKARHKEVMAHVQYISKNH